MTRLIEGLLARLLLRHLGDDDPLRAEIRQRRQSLRRDLGRPATFGARFVMCLVVVDIAALGALVDAGRTRDDAVAAVAEANHRLVVPWLPLMRWSSIFIGLTPLARMRRGFWLVNHLFPFNPPAWEHEHLTSGEVGLDYSRCPVADFCVQQDAADLGSAAVCAQDHELGRAMGVGLVREETLMEGARRCTFRWVE